MQTIPVINCPDLRCALKKIELARSFLRAGDYIHLDVADGVFVFHKTWSDLRAWRDMRVPCKLEVHLMVDHPEIWIEPWARAGAKRFIVHVETVTDHSFSKIKNLCEKNGVELMLSSDPETSVQDMKPYLHATHFFQVLAVNPGLARQKFLPLALEKVVWIRRQVPHATIEVDGGINVETAKLAKDAGADVVVSSSFIFGDKNPKEAFEELGRV
jgi:ribulose-phosphate 3-epimerase